MYGNMRPYKVTFLSSQSIFINKMYKKYKMCTCGLSLLQETEKVQSQQDVTFSQRWNITKYIYSSTVLKYTFEVLVLYFRGKYSAFYSITFI